MHFLKPLAAAALVLGASLAPAAAASEKFGLGYAVERRNAAEFSLDTCMAAASDASAQAGLTEAMTKTHPGQLGIFASGPKGGGSSLTVYCIAVEEKTVFLVQAIDYMNEESPAAAALAQKVHDALMAAQD